MTRGAIPVASHPVQGASDAVPMVSHPVPV
jgi:hypothetical protein